MILEKRIQLRQKTSIVGFPVKKKDSRKVKNFV